MEQAQIMCFSSMDYNYNDKWINTGHIIREILSTLSHYIHYSPTLQIFIISCCNSGVSIFPPSHFSCFMLNISQIHSLFQPAADQHSKHKREQTRLRFPKVLQNKDYCYVIEQA